MALGVVLLRTSQRKSIFVNKNTKKMDYMMMRPDGSFVSTGVENNATTTVEVSYQEAQDFLSRPDVEEFHVDDESYNKGYRFYEIKIVR